MACERDRPHIVLDVLGRGQLGERVYYRALEERRDEALTKRRVVKIGNNWRKFKGEIVLNCILFVIVLDSVFLKCRLVLSFGCFIFEIWGFVLRSSFSKLPIA